jgi:photosystem II stability/assembly factor-like uncharacterized protein
VRGTSLLAVAGFVGAMTWCTACSEAEPVIVFDSTADPAPSSTEPGGVATTSGQSGIPEATAVPSTVPEAEWVDATGNLVGLDSTCENVGGVTAWEGTGAMIASIALQGLWTTADTGSSWAPMGSGAGSVELRNRNRSVIIDPDDSSRIWLSGTGDGGGVFRTDDAGETFRPLGEGFAAGRLSVDTSDPQRLVLVVVDEARNGVLRSRDGGVTWTDISAGLPYNFGQVVAPLVIHEDTLLLGSRDGPLAGVFRSEDGGETWMRSFNGGVSGAPLRRADGSIAWLREYGTGLIVSRDAGVTWQANEGGGIAWTSGSLAELPDGRLVTFGLQQVLLTSDEGVTWRPMGPPLPFLPNGIAYSPHDSAFYIWHHDCGFEPSYPVLPGSIMTLSFVLPEPGTSASQPS